MLQLRFRRGGLAPTARPALRRGASSRRAVPVDSGGGLLLRRLASGVRAMVERRGSSGGGTCGTDSLAPGNALAHGWVPPGDAPAPKLPGPGGMRSHAGAPGAGSVGASALRGPRVLESGSGSGGALGRGRVRLPAFAARGVGGAGRSRPLALRCGPRAGGGLQTLSGLVRWLEWAFAFSLRSYLL